MAIAEIYEGSVIDLEKVCKLVLLFNAIEIVIYKSKSFFNIVILCFLAFN